VGDEEVEAQEEEDKKTTEQRPRGRAAREILWEAVATT